MAAIVGLLRDWTRRRLAAIRASEGGMTLAEILVAVTILGLAIPFIISALGSASMASDRHRKQTTADTVLKSYAEAIKDAIRRDLAPFRYINCAAANGSQYTLASLTSATNWAPPTGYSVSVAVSYRTGTGFSSSCDTSSPNVNTQLLSLGAISSDNRGTETMEIVVRKP